ncbi:Response regulator of zinc sigma-54-dependent two-component system [Minicystis rosea]|nr:Response regulator of zinc sigma-54-dependent two-component system [Minicystis rosea]
MATILVVDDDRTIRDGLVRTLAASGFTTRAAEGIAEARKAIAAGGVDGVLLDIRLKDGDGLDLLGALRTSHPGLPVVMATAYGDSERTILAMKLGAFDYVTKPFDLDHLVETLRRAVKAPPAAPAAAPAEVADAALVGSSARMLAVWKAIGRAATSSVSVLITGESGTGKELVARAIHEHSPRRAAPFVAVNIAALPPTLVESELFGHERGAFTGAATRREGRFEAAGEGTLFLDEIGDLDMGLQTKLLRVLQEGTFERVGSQEIRRSAARIIAATSRPVLPKTPGATLREDLFYRLAVLHLELPPLRDRRSDIPLLVQAFLQRLEGPRRAISEAAMARLVAHAWPGNVRELHHVIERAAVMSTSEVLDESDLALPGAPIAFGAAEADRLDPSEDLNLRRATDALERRLILKALDRAGGNRAEAARLLGIGRPNLYAKMRELGITPD